MSEVSLTQLTREERDHIASMLRSPGWALLLKHLIAPRLQHASNQLDAPGADLPTTQLWRGVKSELRHILQACYACTDTPDPFKEHYQAFLVSLNIPDSPDTTQETEEESLLGKFRAKPPAYPVL